MLIHIYDGWTTTFCRTEAQVISTIADIVNKCKADGSTINIHIERMEDNNNGTNRIRSHPDDDQG